MLGIGTDILYMERFRNVLNTGGAVFINEVYTPAEQAQAGKREEPEVYYATRFAGKEAVLKCLDTAWEHGLVLRDIEILEAANGAPKAGLLGKARDVAAKKGIKAVLVSLSFERDYAIAVAAALNSGS